MATEQSFWDVPAPWEKQDTSSAASFWDRPAPWEAQDTGTRTYALPERKEKAEYVPPAEVYDYLKEKGVSDTHALGILANVKAESAFNARAAGDNGASIGLFQHQGPRRRALVESGPNPYDWRQQVDYALSEPEGQAYLSNDFTTPEAATTWFTKNFERPADADWRAQERVGMLGDVMGKVATGRRRGTPQLAPAGSQAILPAREAQAIARTELPEETKAAQPGLGEQALNFLVSPAAASSDVPQGTELSDAAITALIKKKRQPAMAAPVIQTANPSGELSDDAITALIEKKRAQRKPQILSDREAQAAEPTMGSLIEGQLGQQSADAQRAQADLERRKREQEVAGMGATERVARGFGAGLTDQARGIGQAVGLLNEEDIAKARDEQSALLATPGGKLGSFVGNVAPYVAGSYGVGAIPLAARGIGALRTIAAAANVPGKLGIGAGRTIASGIGGAATGAIQPYTSEEEYLRNVEYGAGGAAALQGIGGALAGAANIGKTVFPATQRTARAKAGEVLGEMATRPAQPLGAPALTAAENAPNVERQLLAAETQALEREARAAEPWEAQSTPEATQNIGLAELSDVVQTHLPAGSQLAEQAVLRNAARANKLQEIAGTPADKALAREERANAAEALYKNMYGQTVPITAEMRDLFARPDMQDAIEGARNLAANRGQPFGLTDTEISGRAAHDIKREMDRIEGTEPYRGTERGDVLKNTKTQYLNEIGKPNNFPDYTIARQTYRDESVPVNRMDVAQYLIEHGTSPTLQLGGTTALLPNKLAQMTRSDEAQRKLIESATGRRDVARNLKELYGEDTTIEDIISRASVSNAAARAGAGIGSPTKTRSETQNKLNRMLAKEGQGERALGGAFSYLTGGLYRPAETGRRAEQIYRELIPALEDPRAAAEAWREYQKALAKRRGETPLSRARRAGATGVTTYGGQVVEGE